MLPAKEELIQQSHFAYNNDGLFQYYSDYAFLLQV